MSTTTARIACPTCDRMGRIVIERKGALTTHTCPNCNGQGYVMDHDSSTCERCIYAKVGYWEYFGLTV